MVVVSSFNLTGNHSPSLLYSTVNGYMIGMVNGKTKRIPLGEVAGKLKTVDPDSQMIKEAKRTGISFGD